MHDTQSWTYVTDTNWNVTFEIQASSQLWMLMAHGFLYSYLAFWHSSPTTEPPPLNSQAYSFTEGLRQERLWVVKVQCQSSIESSKLDSKTESRLASQLFFSRHTTAKRCMMFLILQLIICQVKAPQLTLFAFGEVRRVPILTWQEGEVLRRDSKLFQSAATSDMEHPALITLMDKGEATCRLGDCGIII